MKENKSVDAKTKEEGAFLFWLMDNSWEHSHDFTFKNRLTGESKTVTELRGIFNQKAN